MSTNSSLGRHRAARTHSSPLTAISSAVSSNAGSVGRQAAVIVAASGLVLTAGLPAHGIGESERVVQLSTPLNTASAPVAVVSAPDTADISFERTAVTATPAPVEAAPVVEVQADVVEPLAPVAEPAAEAIVEPAAPEAAPAEAPAAVAAPAAAPAAAAPAEAEAPAPSGNIAAGLVGSAYSQIGVAQDCTAMVEKALRSVGKSVGDIGPSGFFAYGSIVGSPAAGDLVITGGHVAIYVGNGQVISGGLNGMNTGLHALSDLPGASFVRVS